MSDLTPRQREALEWLPRVGKATHATLRLHRFSPRTLDALAARNLVRRDFIPTRGAGYVVYYPIREESGDT